MTRALYVRVRQALAALAALAAGRLTCEDDHDEGCLYPSQKIGLPLAPLAPARAARTRQNRESATPRTPGALHALVSAGAARAARAARANPGVIGPQLSFIAEERQE